MGCMGRSYNKDQKDFEESTHFKFFYMLCKYFKNELKFNDIKIKQYIEISAFIHKNTFDPWKLNSPEYINEFKSWYKINSSKDAYLNSIKESINYVIKFCQKKKIKTIESYIKNWGVTHYTSGILNDNVAYAFGLQDVTLSKPEKFMLRRFIKNIPMIKERLEREGRLKTLIEAEVQKAKEMLIWISD
jgi:hypothetical protein